MTSFDVSYNVPEGFPTHQEHTICYVTSDQTTLMMDQPIKEIMVTAEADLTDLPDTVPIGSLAFLADESKKWRKGADGTWEEIGASSDSTPADNSPDNDA